MIQYQREHNSFLGSVGCIDDSYCSFISTDTQINNIALLQGNILSVDSTFNLNKYWVTDTYYNNIQFDKLERKHPIFLGRCLLHFRKDAFTFNWFFNNMCSFAGRKVEADQYMAIYKGFAMVNTKLKLLLCVYNLEKSHRPKLSKFKPKNETVSKILADIYGCRNGSAKEFGLVDSATEDKFESRLASLKEWWNSLCPEIHGWFTARRVKTYSKRK